jgi:hypothetical protein
MEDEIPCRSADALIERAERLLKLRPFSKKVVDDLTAATLICKLHKQGLAVSVDEAEQCLRRIEIAVDTGIYPDELLRKAEEGSSQNGTGGEAEVHPSAPA